MFLPNLILGRPHFKSPSAFVFVPGSSTNMHKNGTQILKHKALLITKNRVLQQRSLT